MRNGQQVAAFEAAFAEYVDAKYAIALCNGTATLHTALVALGIYPGDYVAVPPLTMASTTLAVLHAGAVPMFVDINPQTWLLTPIGPEMWASVATAIPVSLYGLHSECWSGSMLVDDAAQTLRQHGGAAFTSYSFQASKILALGEGGMLVTNDEELATFAREFSTLGYRMLPNQPRIDPAVLKSPTYERHHTIGFNYRMNDVTANAGLHELRFADLLIDQRRDAAALYREAHADCPWLTPQFVPVGWTHDYWSYTLACDTPQRALRLADAMVRHGGERPYFAWRLTYQEPALRHLAPDGTCRVAEDLQPRLVQLQTNNSATASRNATALRRAIHEVG